MDRQGKIKELESKLSEIHKELDSLKEEKVERWRAEKGDEYWFVDDCAGISLSREDYITADNWRYASGNYFRTKEEAENYKQKVLLIQEIEDFSLMVNGDREVDWNDDGQMKYSFFYNWVNENFISSGNCNGQDVGVIHFLDNVLDEYTERFGERVKKYLL